MHSNSYRLFQEYALPYFEPGMRVLEVGPDPAQEPDGRYSLHKAVREKGAEYYFTGLTNDFTDVTYNQYPMVSEYNIVCPDSHFRIVFSANVIEHVRKPWRWVPELARVTVPGGLLIFINPVSWPYHEAPVDCWRLYPEAYRALFEEAGLEYVFGKHVTAEPIDPEWLHEHGLGPVVDTIAVGRKPGVK